MEIRWCHLDTIDPVQREKIERHIIKLSKEKNDLIDVRIASHLSKHHRHGDCQIRIKGIHERVHVKSESENSGITQTSIRGHRRGASQDQIRTGRHSKNRLARHQVIPRGPAHEIPLSV